MSTETEDRHGKWFEELRRLNTLLMECGVADHQSSKKKELEEQVAHLQDLMIETEARTREEVLFQLELLQGMLWANQHQRLATKIKAAVKNLPTGGS